MRNDTRLSLGGGMALLALLGWSWPQPTSTVTDKPAKIQILYTSDAVGYHEPCG